jgi:hypothetical protein
VISTNKITKKLIHVNLANSATQQHDISKGLARKATKWDLNPGPTEAPGYM